MIINWEKFPKLKTVKIYSKNVNLDNIHKYCPELEFIYIELTDKKKINIQNILYLSKLKFFISNLFHKIEKKRTYTKMKDEKILELNKSISWCIFNNIYDFNYENNFCNFHASHEINLSFMKNAL